MIMAQSQFLVILKAIQVTSTTGINSNKIHTKKVTHSQYKHSPIFCCTTKQLHLILNFCLLIKVTRKWTLNVSLLQYTNTYHVHHPNINSYRCCLWNMNYDNNRDFCTYFCHSLYSSVCHLTVKDNNTFVT